MSRRPASVTQADIARAIRAAKEERSESASEDISPRKAGLKGVHKVRKRLADGTVRTHYYLGRGKGSRRIEGEFGSQEFIENYNEAKRPPAAGYIYFLWAGNRIKIGFSRKPYKRIFTLQTGISAPVKMMLAVVGTPSEEKQLHRLLSDFRVQGEWFIANEAVRRIMMESAILGHPALQVTNE